MARAGLLLKKPTAQALLGEVAAKPVRSPSPGQELGTRAHVVPFQCGGHRERSPPKSSRAHR
jgi:hypothetical protein